MYHSLKSSNPLPARFYGLPEIHKPNNPLRAIVSFCGSPAYNLASFYNNVISENTTPPISRVKNSFDSIEKIKNTKVPPGYKIISLDAVHSSPTFKLDSLWKVSSTGGPEFNHMSKWPDTNLKKVSEHVPPTPHSISKASSVNRNLVSRWAPHFHLLPPISSWTSRKMHRFASILSLISFQICGRHINSGTNQRNRHGQKPTWSGHLLNLHSHYPLKYKVNIINNLVDTGITLTQKLLHKKHSKN